MSAEEELLEPMGLEEIFVDGFTKHSARDGYMTCLGYRKLASGPIAVIRLVWPTINTEAAIEDAREALAAPAQHTSRRDPTKRGVH